VSRKTPEHQEMFFHPCGQVAHGTCRVSQAR